MLSNMWRVLDVVEQMSQSLTDASRHLQKALIAIDTEMSVLQTRLHADAESLRTGIARARLEPADRAVLLATLARIEDTADSVASFSHRSTIPTRGPGLAMDTNNPRPAEP